MIENDRGAELRRFLKERRARIQPGEVGLPSGSRRRVPGLRREEVAALAGIGVSWYTELESGVAAGASKETLIAIASALRLSDAEREYFFALGSGEDDRERIDVPSRLAVATMKAQLFPAYLITPTWDVYDVNGAYRRVWALEENQLPFNAAELFLFHPVARKMHGDNYISNVRPVVAMLRSSHGRQLQSEVLRSIRDRILTDDLLAPLWHAYEINSPLFSNSCTLHSPIGLFTYETLNLPISGHRHSLVVHVPDSDSQMRLAAAMRS